MCPLPAELTAAIVLLAERLDLQRPVIMGCRGQLHKSLRFTCYLFFQKEHKHIFEFYVIPPH